MDSLEVNEKNNLQITFVKKKTRRHQQLNHFQRDKSKRKTSKKLLKILALKVTAGVQKKTEKKIAVHLCNFTLKSFCFSREGRCFL